MKKCRFFEIHELVPPDVYEAEGERAWGRMDDNLCLVLDTLRWEYGPITVNNWKSGGDRKYSGFRPEDCPVGAKASQHKKGRAADCLFKYHTADEVRKDVLKKIEDGHPVFSRIRGIEDGVSWFHVDTRERDTLLVFKP